ncbi:cysteine proteinase [Daldinia caldariorum]|uniref:cysteine proteinase n=1 Tax=Daldinia caldariorum TaxID=326644 RepID=UPI0020084068|nr:cysteine proteinase [Daldinia caldariorum]KAI1465026.1 cysteine proteinase [Daldinia caldariorum]
MEAKAKEREALASKTQGKDALDHAAAAAELYMKAAQGASSPEEKSRLIKKCQSLLSKAESLKKLCQAGGSVAVVEKRLKLPRSARQIPKSEQAILLRNSRLHGSIFLPWDSDPNPDEFTGNAFSDPYQFSLSAHQLSVFSGWKRPLEILDRETELNPPEQHNNFLMRAQNDYDLVQDITTDCSVVASLCAIMRHLRPGPTSILPALMFPIDLDSGQPKISDSGKYIFRMHFNGCFRKVVIDDRLPSSSTGRTLYVVDRQNPNLIWPALMEKAYLKVRGGYDFPGSNSGTDLYALTGWIPQQLFLQNEEVDWDRTWKRVKKAYDFGDVVVTLGTGRLSLDEEETLGLAGEHDYAVLDMTEASGSRRLLVKNPWCDGLSWKGTGSVDISQQATDDHPVKLKPGTFWISFDDVAQNFESLYLNWNPSLFTERQDHHFTWQLPEATMIGSFAHSPQYSMSTAVDGNVWILLSRHFQNDELDIMRKYRLSNDDAAISSLAEVSSRLGFMSIYIFANSGGKRVQLSTQPVFCGDFVDSPQTLAPFEAKRGVTYTIVVATEKLPLPQYSFTLSFFSRAPLVVAPAEPALRHYMDVKGSWTRRTAGGNAASSSYLENPQFSLVLPRPGPLSLLLSTARDDLPVHVDLVWAGGRRVTAIGNRDLAITSGDYRRGCALAEAPSVDAGTYTIVCSTFDPGCLADFTLRVGSDIPCAVAPVPADAAGRLRTQLPDLVFRGPASLSLSSSDSEVHKKKRVAISAARLTRASVVVTMRDGYRATPRTGAGGGATTPRSHPTVRASVEVGTGPDRLVVASTDTTRTRGSSANEFREVGANGLRTGDFDIDPRGRGLWIVVEQLGLYHAPTTVGDGGVGGVGGGGGGGGELRVEVLSEGPVQVGAWEAVDG